MWTFTIIISSLPITLSVVNCGKACSECRLETLHPQLVEVYCAMCSECQETGSYRSWDPRRSMLDDWEKYDSYLIRKLRTEGGDGEKAPDEGDEACPTAPPCPSYEDEGCPTAPPCPSYEDEGTTTCPPILPCKPKKRPTTTRTTTTRPKRKTKCKITKPPNDCFKDININVNCCNEPCNKDKNLTEEGTKPKKEENNGQHILYVGIPKEIDQST